MSPREIAARRTALTRVSGQKVHVMSGATGQGVPEMLRALQNAITAHRAGGA
jgi:GTP-binding protein